MSLGVRRAAFERTAIQAGNEWMRAIPADEEHRNGNDLLVQAGDLIYGNTHIAVCTINLLNQNEQPNLDVYLTEEERGSRYFTIMERKQ